MRLQNIISATVFALLLAAYASMHLLNAFPANSLLWYVNITFAREARPVFELFDQLPVSSSLGALATILGFLALCMVATRQRSKIITTFTTHSALFTALFASIASYGGSMGPQISSSTGFGDIVYLTSTLSPVNQAMAAMVAILFVTCLGNHLDILKGIVADIWQKTSTS